MPKKSHNSRRLEKRLAAAALTHQAARRASAEAQISDADPGAAPSGSLTVGQIVTGTVARVDEQYGRYGVFFNIRGGRDAVCCADQLDKELGDYKDGDKVEGLRIAKIDGDKVEVTTRRLASEATVGEKVKGIVMTKIDAGICFNAGFSSDVLALTSMLSKAVEEYSEQDVLDLTIVQVVGDKVIVSDKDAKSLSTFILGQSVVGTAKNHLEKPLEAYTPGMELTGLRVTQVDPEKQQLSVSMPPGASDYTIGDEVNGKVTKKMPFALFVDIGACVNALLPATLLEKQLDEYEEHEELEGLRISYLNPDSNQIFVSQKGGQDDSSAKISFSDLQEGKQIPGVGRAVRDDGASVDIGLGRTDALMPNSMMGDTTGAAFKPNQELEAAGTAEHPLQRRWYLRLHAKDSSPREVHTFATVEGFWCMFHHAYPPSKFENVGFSLFKQGVAPAQEDAAFENGGRWAITLDTLKVDIAWLSTYLSLIGEAFYEHGPEVVCGATVFVSADTSTISLWVSFPEDEKTVMGIGREYRNVLASTPELQELATEKMTFIDFQKQSATYIL